LSVGQPLNGFTAAAKIIHWLEIGERLSLPINLDTVRELLPETPLGQSEIIKPPQPITWSTSEGALVRNPDNEKEWGIFYNAKAGRERQRFTIAHELGHFILHRNSQTSFDCSKESIYTGIDGLKQIEREADDFASNLLMPGNLLRQKIEGQKIDFRLLGKLANEFGVSLEAMCIRFVKYTTLRAALVYWDHGFMKYQWRSQSAIRTKAKLRQSSEPQEPPLNSLAADEDIEQELDGIEMSANVWCPAEPSDICLREMKHTYREGNRILSLLILETAAPLVYPNSGWEEERSHDSFDQFVDNGQLPVRS
jgi:Zn-dependent peptidase ImmA (M78 family)